MSEYLNFPGKELNVTIIQSNKFFKKKRKKKVYVYIYVCVSVYIYIYVCMCIYIYRERESFYIKTKDKNPLSWYHNKFISASYNIL